MSPLLAAWGVGEERPRSVLYYGCCGKCGRGGEGAAREGRVNHPVGRPDGCSPAKKAPWALGRPEGHTTSGRGGDQSGSINRRRPGGVLGGETPAGSHCHWAGSAAGRAGVPPPRSSERPSLSGPRTRTTALGGQKPPPSVTPRFSGCSSGSEGGGGALPHRQPSFPKSSPPPLLSGPAATAGVRAASGTLLRSSARPSPVARGVPWHCRRGRAPGAWEVLWGGCQSGR